MARYLVTGGCGFIGSHLVDALLAAGHGVRVVDDLSTGTRTHLAPAAEFVLGDLRDSGIVQEAVTGVGGCFHLAAVASVARCNEAWHDSHLANLAATVALFEAAARDRIPVVYASSAAVYGDNPDVPLREDAPRRPLSPYGADKAAAELHARAGATVRGLSSIGLRFFNVYGPRQRLGDSYSGVISNFLARVAKRQPLLVHGDGAQSRDFVFVGDVVAALRSAMARLEQAGAPAAEVHNVCTGRAVSVADLARLLMAATGVTVPLGHGPPRPGDVHRSVGCPDRAAQALGFRAAVAINEGLHRLTGTSADKPTDPGRRAP